MHAAATQLLFGQAGSMPPPAAQGGVTAAAPPRQRQRAIFHPQSAGQNTRGAKHETERLSSPLLSSPLNRGSTTSCALRARLRPSAPPSSSSMR
ncbi:hypothetical protein ZWY2020_007206 [Hordeum vulgare]|nr:hypothetical protein ZWY2020_007206 [Hordeum vulgare]